MNAQVAGVLVKHFIDHKFGISHLQLVPGHDLNLLLMDTLVGIGVYRPIGALLRRLHVEEPLELIAKADFPDLALDDPSTGTAQFQIDDTRVIDFLSAAPEDDRGHLRSRVDLDLIALFALRVASFDVAESVHLDLDVG